MTPIAGSEAVASARSTVHDALLRADPSRIAWLAEPEGGGGIRVHLAPLEVADRLASTEGVAEVHSVAGRYDLVAIVRVATNEAMADLVTSGLLGIDGIARTCAFFT